ncbi:hypothetical protein Mapa_008152 [Marchantia paleacea]|nr:hypothetical protein Mapa_008152 [Marchantia paleacea]
MFEQMILYSLTKAVGEQRTHQDETRPGEARWSELLYHSSLPTDRRSTSQLRGLSFNSAAPTHSLTLSTEPAALLFFYLQWSPPLSTMNCHHLHNRNSECCCFEFEFYRNTVSSGGPMPLSTREECECACLAHLACRVPSTLTALPEPSLALTLTPAAATFHASGLALPSRRDGAFSAGASATRTSASLLRSACG